ncbi:MAG: hypothetical protein V4708_04995 [Bacteroidota bacterium]
MNNLLRTSMMTGAITLLITSQSYISSRDVKSAPFNTAFEIKLDEEVFLPKSKKELSVSLLNVTDNRCPENVRCITGGKAVAQIKLTNKHGSEAITKLALEQSPGSSDTIDVTLDDKHYTVILNEVNRLFANKVKLVVSKTSI